MDEVREPLHGLSVVITRPAGQSGRLAERVEAAGGIAVLLPLFGIEPLVPASIPSAHPAPIVTLFVSVNAVRHGLSIVRPLMAPGGIVIGVGTATMAALRGAGLQPRSVPADMIGSEGLLELPELSTSVVRGQRVLLVSGRGGRELLHETLTERGAIVLDVEVYERVPRDIPIAATIEAAGAIRPDILVLTSNESVDQMLKLIRRQQQTTLLRCSIAVMSERIAAHARVLGFSGPVAVAPQTSDDGLMQAIVQLAAR